MIRSLERPLGARRTPAPPLDEHPLVRRAARWRPTLAQVWAAVPFGVAAWWPGLMGLEPLDYWWTVKMGELIWQTGALPVSDPLTHTPIREPVIAGQWLAQLLLSAVHAAGGVELALTVRMAILLAMVGLLLRSALDGGAGVRAAAVAAIFCGWLAIVGVAVRPQLLAIIPFLLIARAAQAPPTNLAGRLALAAVVAIWANVHGSFVLAYALLGAGLLQAAWDRRTGDDRCRLLSLVWLTPLCAAAPLVNPYGPGLVRYVADAVLFNGVGGEVGVRALEWQPPTLRSVHGAAFFGSVVLVMALLARGQRPRAGEAALLLLFGLMSVQAVRNVVWWGFVLAPFLARGLSAWRTADRSGRAEGAG